MPHADYDDVNGPQGTLANLQVAFGELDCDGFPSIRVMRVRSPTETTLKLHDLMEHSLCNCPALVPAPASPARPAAAAQRRPRQGSVSCADASPVGAGTGDPKQSRIEILSKINSGNNALASTMQIAAKPNGRTMLTSWWKVPMLMPTTMVPVTMMMTMTAPAPSDFNANFCKSVATVLRVVCMSFAYPLCIVSVLSGTTLRLPQIRFNFFADSLQIVYVCFLIAFF